MDEVLNEAEKVEEFEISCKRSHRRIVLHIIINYAFAGGAEDRKIFNYRFGNRAFVFNTTKEKYIETVNAVEVLTRLYDRERVKIRKVLFFGFLEKHDLFHKPAPGEKEKKRRSVSEEEMAARQAGSSLSRHMADAEIRRRIGAGE